MNREIYLRDVDRAIQALPDVQKLRSARILITGATGLVGAFLTDCLLALSDQNALDLRLYALCRNAARAKERFGERVNAIAADVSEATALPECDYIIHAASNAHPKAFSAESRGHDACKHSGRSQSAGAFARAGARAAAFAYPPVKFTAIIPRFGTVFPKPILAKSIP